MNRAERIYRLHQLLKGRRPVPLAGLIAKLAISKATIKRDIAYMRNFMDAPIEYCREHNGYRYASDAPEFELPGLWFNDTELYALLATEQMLEAVQPGLLTPYIGPLKARIRKLLEQSGLNSEVITQRICLQPVAMRRLDDECFGIAASAVLNGKPVYIEYNGRQRGETTSRTVHPYRLIHYRDNWYLLGWCERAKELRMFSIDRIGRIEARQGELRQYNNKEVERYQNASFGIFSGNAKHWAVLRFSPFISQWVADEQWHTDQIGQWKGDRYELQIPYSDERELLMDILKYGPDVEVISPETLRNATIEKLTNSLGQYQGK